MMSDPSDISARLDFALEIAREAGWITLEYFRSSDLKVERKEDDSPVTMADRRAEEHLRHRIVKQYGGDAILGEELPEVAGDSGFRWILDPIDGTKSFVHGVPLYTTLIGVEYQGEPILGVIRAPALDESIYAATGQGAWSIRGQLPPKAALVSKIDKLSEGLFVTSEVATFDENGRRDAYDKIQQAARLSRSWGDAYGYMLIATGRAEVMVDPVVNLWDLAALPTIIEEAGGVLTDFNGQRTIHSGHSIATNGLVHDEVLSMIGR